MAECALASGLILGSSLAGGLFGVAAAAQAGPGGPLIGLIFGTVAGVIASPAIFLILRDSNLPLIGFMVTAVLTLCLMPLAWVHEYGPVVTLFLGPWIYVGVAALMASVLPSRPRITPGQCRKCQYPIAGLPGPTCPECGTPISPREQRSHE